MVTEFSQFVGKFFIPVLDCLKMIVKTRTLYTILRTLFNKKNSGRRSGKKGILIVIKKDKKV